MEVVNITLQLTQKERMLLEDQKGHEEVCIQKYTSYANQAQDPNLQQLFQTYAAQEQEHYNSINQILSGQLPNTSQQQGQQNQQKVSVNSQMNMNSTSMGSKDNDAALCNDLLMTEKYVSGTYDTAIFEFVDSNVRQVLNHIQKEEQQHGEGIFNYMASNGMYNPQ